MRKRASAFFDLAHPVLKRFFDLRPRQISGIKGVAERHDRQHIAECDFAFGNTASDSAAVCDGDVSSAGLFCFLQHAVRDKIAEVGFF